MCFYGVFFFKNTTLIIKQRTKRIEAGAAESGPMIFRPDDFFLIAGAPAWGGHMGPPLQKNILLKATRHKTGLLAGADLF